MEIILTQDVKGLGYKHDVVTVKPGYARNYLVPQGIAMIASKPNLKMVQELSRQQARKAEKVKQDALDRAAQMGDLKVEIKTKAGGSGKIFGAVTTTQIAEVLTSKGFEADRRDIQILGDIKTLGEFKASIELHKEVKHEFTVIVSREED